MKLQLLLSILENIMTGLYLDCDSNFQEMQIKKIQVILGKNKGVPLSNEQSRLAELQT